VLFVECKYSFSTKTTAFECVFFLQLGTSASATCLSNGACCVGSCFFGREKKRARWLPLFWKVSFRSERSVEEVVPPKKGLVPLRPRRERAISSGGRRERARIPLGSRRGFKFFRWLARGLNWSSSSFTLNKLECSKQACFHALNTLAWDNRIGLWFYCLLVVSSFY